MVMNVKFHRKEASHFSGMMRLLNAEILLNNDNSIYTTTFL